MDFADNGKGDYSGIWNVSNQNGQYSFHDETNAGLVLLAGMQLGALPNATPASSTSSPSSSAPSSTGSALSKHISHTNIGAIVGGVIAGAVLLILLATLIVWRRHKLARSRSIESDRTPDPLVYGYIEKEDALQGSPFVLTSDNNSYPEAGDFQPSVSMAPREILDNPPQDTPQNSVGYGDRPHHDTDNLTPEQLVRLINHPTTDLVGLLSQHLHQREVVNDRGDGEDEFLPAYGTEISGTFRSRSPQSQL